MKQIILVFLLGMNLFANSAFPANSDPSSYEKALNMIHAYGGSGNELQEALIIINDLSESHPNAGYAETLLAEILSTWKLKQDGTPTELRDHVIELADKALRMNPNLVQAHVAKSRALLRSSRYDDAISEIDIALAQDPEHAGATFIRAEVYRRTNDIVRADIWYRKFISLTPSKSRKSNGYYWLGKGYDDAAWTDSVNRDVYTDKAREAYETMVELDPMHAWKNVNFAIFLNSYAADFDAAEEYAHKALDIMEFRMARFHLAAARYQKLLSEKPSVDLATLKKRAREIEASTRVSLADAISFSSFSSVVRNRLIALAQDTYK